MKKQFRKWVVVGCAVAAVPAFAQGTAQQQQMPRSQQQMQQKDLKQQLGMPLPKDAQGVLSRVHEDNQHEIELGRLAQQKAQGPAVKQFGQTMVQDHQALDQQVQQTAKQQNLKLGKVKPADDVEKKMQAAKKAKMDELKALSGMAFDHAYMAHMVNDHDNAILLTQGVMQTMQDPQLTQLLQQALPAFQKHRQQAYRILGQLGQAQGVGGGGMHQEGMMEQHRMEQREMQRSPTGSE